MKGRTELEHAVRDVNAILESNGKPCRAELRHGAAGLYVRLREYDPETCAAIRSRDLLQDEFLRYADSVFQEEEGFLEF